MTLINLDELTSWDADWKGLKVVVTGMGLSGFSAADTLIELGAEVVVVDAAENEKTLKDADTLKIVGAKDVLLGQQAVESLQPAETVLGVIDVVVTSPGWRPDQPLLAEAAEKNIPVWGDIELAWRVRERAGRRTARWVVLTGTNGKTTVATMAESMAKAAGLDAVAVGNVGTPILDAIRYPDGFDLLIVELSSFQLHWTHHIEPEASVVLNLAEDHLDWHGGFENYIADKAKIYENTRTACIFNEEEPETMRMVEEADVQEGCRAISFWPDTPGLSMLGVVDGLLVDRAFLKERKTQALELASFTDIGAIVPRHTVANALAAAALVRAVGVEPAFVQQGLRDYQSEPHRIELVTEKSDVLWVDDSKATNPHATNAALAAFDPIIWIAGGLPKGLEYFDLVKDHSHRLKAVILLGTDVGPLSEALQRHAPQVPVHTEFFRQTENDPANGWAVMEAAVRTAREIAEGGETVLLSPAAASMDQFSSYNDRGDAFKDAVQKVVTQPD